ncbi:MAG: D-alanyl-D-alanine carboxypeptidase family protein [Thermoleophilaceae bacterium]
MRRRLAVAAVAAALVAGPASTATAAERAEAPATAGTAAVVIDARDGRVLTSNGPDERHPIASTTKLMTALLTIERADPRDVFRAVDYDALPAESKIDLRPGERMRVRDLLTALMLESANDASATLAERVAGSRAAFVRAMNARAVELGLSNTSYANPIGLDDPDNYSSARDLATLARRLMSDRGFRALVDRPRATLRSGARPRTLENRNRLVRRAPFVDGVKTGHTARAGWVLVGSATGRGARVISVVLGEPSEAAREADTLALLRWGIDRFRRVTAVREGRTLARPAVADYEGRRVRLTAARDVVLTVRRGERLATRVRAPSELAGPLPKGRRVGTAMVLARGRPVRRVALVTAEAVPEAGLIRRLGSHVSLPVLGVVALIAVAAILLMRRRRGARRPRASAAR